MAIDFTIGKCEDHLTRSPHDSRQSLSLVYANSLLASLNSRNYLRGQESSEASGNNINSIHLSNLPDLSTSGELDTPRSDSHKFRPRSQDPLDASARPEYV